MWTHLEGLDYSLRESYRGGSERHEAIDLVPAAALAVHPPPKRDTGDRGGLRRQYAMRE